MKEETKLMVQLCIACVVMSLGCLLLIAGFCVPPLGIIDSSVLIAFGEICSFVGALLGIDYTYRYKVHKIKSQQ